MNTVLLYLDDFKRVTCDARVVAIAKENDRDVVILDQTIFYPQGGGQPYDQGVIKGNDSLFTVQEVRAVDGQVKHIGLFTGTPCAVGQMVACTIDRDRRMLNTRIHAAGHVIDRALFELGFQWLPGKSYHFPNGPYVEYAASLRDVSVEKLKADIERLCAAWAAQGLAVTARVLSKKDVLSNEQLNRRSTFVVNVPDETPIYVVAYGDNFASPCSGTHVDNVSEIGPITIRKIKETDGGVRISYDVTRSN